MTGFFGKLAAAAALLLGAAGVQAGVQASEVPAYTDPLPSDPVAITRSFFDDHTAWNAYAHAQYEQTEDFSGAEAAYRRLIDLYCGADKQHQGLVFGSDPDFDAERAAIVGQREEGGKSIVKVHHTRETGFVAEYDFWFKRSGDGWLLDEVFYYDDYGDQWLPRL